MISLLLLFSAGGFISCIAGVIGALFLCYFDVCEALYLRGKYKDSLIVYRKYFGEQYRKALRVAWKKYWSKLFWAAWWAFVFLVMSYATAVYFIHYLKSM